MKAKKLVSILLAAGVLFLGLRIPVRADGMILPPDYYPVYETEQKALIIYKDGTEDLVISISFSGKASDFGWVVPLPERPEISKVDSSVFKDLSELTRPKENLLDKIRGDGYIGPMYGVAEFAAPLDAGREETTVEVIEEESIGIYDYAVLKAGDPEDLRDWMEDNNYNLPSGEKTDGDYYPFSSTKSQSELWDDALPIFQDYIDDDWYFVTVKVNNKFSDSGGVEKQLEEGAVDPLRFTFETTDMIYPMKMTGLASRDISVVLYVLDDHKVYVDNYDRDYCNGENDEECSYFDTSYAAKIKKSEIEELTKEVGKGSWYTPEKDMYISKLYAGYLSYEVMDDDVLFADAKDNQGVNDGSMSFAEWVELPFVLLVYLPYLVLGGFLDLVDYGGYGGYEFGMVWFIGVGLFLFLGSAIWIAVSTILLKKARRKSVRVILYMLQIPSVWLVSLTLSLFLAVPFGILVAFLSQDEAVVFIDGFCCMSLMTVVFPVFFYWRLWRKRNEDKRKVK
ncbi:DUF2330 domain-containing protein [Candidatus Dojkabacteria bacterium]|nr:DUF2330 domain-containing protein [Candidatus Dojkabacteria bacterium]